MRTCSLWFIGNVSTHNRGCWTPTKPEIGKVSLKITDKIYTLIRWKLRQILGGNTSAVTKWFARLNQEIHSIWCWWLLWLYHWKTLKDLFSGVMKKKTYFLKPKNCFYLIKTSHGELFDVTVGSFEGAETFELIGVFLLSQLTRLSPACQCSHLNKKNI